MFALEVDRAPFHAPAAGRKLARHRVERFHERSKLVVALRFDPLIEAAGTDLPGRGGQHLNGPRNPLRHVEAHPGRADENHQRDHQEERQIHAGERPLQDAQLRVVLERLGHTPRPRRHFPGEVIGGDDDTLGFTVGRADDGRGVQEVSRAAERFDRRVRRPAERLSGQPIGGRATVPRRHRGCRDVEDRFETRQRSRRGAGGPCRHDAVHLDDLHALQRHIGRQQIAERPDVALRQVHGRQRTRHASGVFADQQLALVVVVARDLVGRRQDLVHRRVEPPVDARADQLAADDEHQDRRHERHREQEHDQLGAEARERQRLPPLHDELDDVARQHEDQRDEHRQVGSGERVEHELAEKIRRETRRASGDHQQRDQHADEDADAGEDEARVVPERTARGLRRRPGATGASRRD